MGAAYNNEKIHGFWTIAETQHSINYLELLAIFLALKSFPHSKRNCEILIRVDNTTALSYINKMGGSRYEKYNQLTAKIWKWAEKRHLWLFVSHIPGKENVEADKQSRIKNIDTEWELANFAYKRITINFGTPSIDLFATRINKICKRYCSWHKDPDATYIDAFTVSWKKFYFYEFPPFSIIAKILQKIINEKATGVVVVPYWTAQSWYPVFTSLLIEKPLLIKPNKKLLLSPCRSLEHPLANQLTLLVGKLPGNLT